MAILTILENPHKNLRKKALPVESIDETIKTLAADMFETMYAAPGVGLAANQVNVQKRVVVIDVSEEKNTPLCFINPEILEKSGTEEREEGCLSVPGICEKVTRAEKVKVRALDIQGVAFELEADGLLAVCIQHEIDHLEGKLFIDYISPLKLQRARKKLEKEKKLKAAETSKPKASVAI